MLERLPIIRIVEPRPVSALPQNYDYEEFECSNDQVGVLLLPEEYNASKES